MADGQAGRTVPTDPVGSIAATVLDQSLWRLDRYDEWLLVTPPANPPVPPQGWKLHLSSFPEDYLELLGRALPVIAEFPTPAKLVGSVGAAERLCAGLFGRSQVGKLVTIYPADGEAAVRLSGQLDRATRGLAGPPVITDRRLTQGSAVFYRYGAFVGLQLRTRLGAIVPAMRDPAGDLEPDPRESRCVFPSWVTDPFGGNEALVEQSPRLLADRFISGPALRTTYRTSVAVAADIATGRLCVLKRVFSGARTPTPGWAQGLLREYEVLESLRNEPGFPRPLALFADAEDLVLAQDEIPGRSLDALLLDGVNAAGELQGAIDIAIQICEQLLALARHGWAHGDVSPGNVLVDGPRAQLVDFELAHCDGAQPRGAGTLGYTAPERVAGAAPSQASDVYALGSVLRSMVARVDPGVFPDQSRLDSLDLRTLQPDAPALNAALVAACLRSDPQRRPSLPELHRRLVGYDRFDPPPPQSHRVEPERVLGTLLAWFVEQATMSALPLGQRPGWQLQPDLGGGTAGVALTLCAITQAGLIDDQAAARAVWSLLNVEQPPGAPAPGLYVGAAGHAVARLFAGHMLDDARLVRAGEGQLRAAARMPCANPDLLSGRAGVLRAQLLAWQITGAEEFLDAAQRSADLVLDSARRDGDHVWWPTAEANAGQPWVGYAHGTAGIADCLVDLFRITGRESAGVAASGAAAFLAGQTRPRKGGIDWPAVAEGAGTTPRWCHGAVGVGRFLLAADQCGLWHDAGLVQPATDAALTGGVLIGPTLCHGAAGVADLLLDVHSAWPAQKWDEALARILELLDGYVGGELPRHWWSGDQVQGPTLLPGLGGTLLVLLRLTGRLAHDPLRPR